MVAFITSFMILMLLGVPIAFSIIVTCMFFLSITGLQPLIIIPQRMVTGTDSFILVAIPLFILVGNVMDRGGMSRRLINWADACVGFLRGGIGYAVILSCAVFATLTGSGPATVAAIGTTMIPSMIKKGYSKYSSVGIVACSGCLGPIIPPSIPMIIYGVTMSLSVTDMFIGGIIPGVLIAFLLAIVNFRIAKTPEIQNFPRTIFSLKVLLNNTLKASTALFLPVLILGGIYIGVFSHRSCGVGVIYSLIISLFVNKELKLRDIPELLIDSFRVSSIGIFITGVANIMSFIMGNAKFSEQIVDFLTRYMVNETQYLIILMLVLFIIGCLFETLPAIILLAPLLVPTGIALGVDPLHLGVLFVINLVVGFVTPPFGTNLFTAVSITGMEFSDVLKGAVPFIVVEILAVIIIAFNPWMVTWLPRLLH